MNLLENLKLQLNACGLKATPQRLVILETLNQMQNHPTAELLYEQVKPKHPGMSLATVYKNLETLVATGMVQKVSTRETHMRYDGNVQPHHHVFCTNTQEIIDFSDPELEKLLKEYFDRKDVRNLDIKEIRVNVRAEKRNPEAESGIE